MEWSNSQWSNPPSRFTPALSPTFKSAIDPYIKVIQFIWRIAFGYVLDQWQIDILRHALELDNGKLRHRSYLISLPRQAGKSELMTALAIWQLLSNPIALVIGIASSVEQARIIYDRVKLTITRLPALAARFSALTDTRGLRTPQGGRLELKAAKGAALQGLAIVLGIVDEVHLLSSELWDALLNGTGARANAIVIGITTAGDDSSTLLKHLYGLGDTQAPSFGYVIYESPEAYIPESDDELARLLTIANPAVAAGRTDVKELINIVRSQPESSAIRYNLNRFVSGTDDMFLPVGTWQKLASSDPFPDGKCYITVDVDPGWSYATMTRSIKVDGTIHTKMILSMPNPNVDELERRCKFLYGKLRPTFVMDNKPLAERLAKGGYPVKSINGGGILAASSIFYARAAQSKIKHANDPLVAYQLPHSIRKTVGDGFKVYRRGKDPIDAIRATVIGVYAADSFEENKPLLV